MEYTQLCCHPPFIVLAPPFQWACPPPLSLSLQNLHQSIPAQEELAGQLVACGKALLATMEEGSVAEQYVDGQLSDVESRLADLVTPHSGSIDTRESAVNKVCLYACACACNHSLFSSPPPPPPPSTPCCGQVISAWRGYNGMLSGTRMFIGQLAKMVGPEPIESSNGNNTLLNTYIVSHAHFT